MKKLLLLLLLIFTSYAATFAQSYNSQSSLERFFENGNAVKGLAQCAHPFNTYTRGYYSIDGNKVTVTAYYSSNAYTVITAIYERSGDYFSSVSYTEDTDDSPPFLGIMFIKSALLEMFGQGESSCLERFFRQSVNDMTGTQLTRVFLTDAWWKWNGKQCNAY